MVWTIFGGALAEIYDHIEVHRNDSATFQDMTLTSWRFGAGLIRNISTELYHVLITLTSTKRQISPRGWKRIDFFSGVMNRFRRSQQSRNLWICLQMDSLTNSKRRVSFWEQDAQETLSNSINIGLVIKCFEKGCFRDHLLINTGEKAHAACSDGLVGDGQSRSKVPRKLSWCVIYSHMARGCGKKAEHVQDNQTSGWSGTDDKTKGKSGKDKSANVQGKGKPGKGKRKDKSNGKGKQHGKRGKKGFHEMEGCDGLAFSSFLPLVLFSCERLSQPAVFSIAFCVDACLAQGQPVSLHLMGI